MCRLIRVPHPLDKCFRPLPRHCHRDHCEYFRWLVLAMACAWGRHNVAHVYRYLDAQHHRTRFTNFFCPPISAADVIRTYENRWTIEPWVKDAKQLLGHKATGHVTRLLTSRPLRLRTSCGGNTGTGAGDVRVPM